MNNKPIRTKVLIANDPILHRNNVKAQRTAAGMAVTVLTIVIVVAALAFGAYGLTKAPATETSYATSTTTYTTTIISTTTASVMSACSPAASQENPLLTFRINVQYNGPWNATAIGSSNTTANQAFQKCYSGNGNGWIQIADWNPNGGAILNLTVQKSDASTGNLTAIGNGQVRSTVVPFGAVTMSLTAVP